MINAARNCWVTMLLAGALYVCDTLASTQLAAPQRESGGSEQPKGPMECPESSEDSRSLNSLELFQRASVCFANADEFLGSFHLIAGQIRAATDMTLLKPLTDEDEKAIGELYLLFYQAGGAEPDNIYRNKRTRERLFEAIAAWIPRPPDENFDPGWNYEKLQASSQYIETIIYQSALRIGHLKRFSAMINNEVYYKAKIELDEIQERNPEGTLRPDIHNMKQGKQ